MLAKNHEISQLPFRINKLEKSCTSGPINTLPFIQTGKIIFRFISFTEVAFSPSRLLSCPFPAPFLSHPGRYNRWFPKPKYHPGNRGKLASPKPRQRSSFHALSFHLIKHETSGWTVCTNEYVSVTVDDSCRKNRNICNSIAHQDTLVPSPPHTPLSGKTCPIRNTTGTWYLSLSTNNKRQEHVLPFYRNRKIISR